MKRKNKVEDIEMLLTLRSQTYSEEFSDHTPFREETLSLKHAYTAHGIPSEDSDSQGPSLTTFPISCS